MQLEHFSYSQLRMLSACGEQYRRRYIGGEKTPPGIALHRGTAIHKSQEVNLKHKAASGELLSVEEVVQIASDTFKLQMKGPYTIGGQYEELTPEEARAMAYVETTDLARLHAEEVAPLVDPREMEVRIEIPAGGDMPVKFISIIDLIDGETIADTKSKQKSPSKGDADESTQLTSQRLAYTAAYGKPPGGLRLDTLVRTPKKGECKYAPLKTTRTPGAMDALVARIQSAVTMIEKEIFLPAPDDSWACSTKWCGYAATCPFFRGRNRPTT